MDLREALTEFLASGPPQLPILDDAGRVAGLVRLHDILSQYGRMVGTDGEPHG